MNVVWTVNWVNEEFLGGWVEKQTVTPMYCLLGSDMVIVVLILDQRILALTESWELVLHSLVQQPVNLDSLYQALAAFCMKTLAVTVTAGAELDGTTVLERLKCRVIGCWVNELVTHG